MSLHSLPCGPECVWNKIFARDARELRNLWEVLDRYGTPLRNRRWLQTQMPGQPHLHSAICFEELLQAYASFRP